MLFNTLPVLAAGDINTENPNVNESLVGSDEEFICSGGGALSPRFTFSDTLSENVPITRAAATYPSSYNTGPHTGKDQKDTNLCWVFATISNFETAIYTQKRKEYDLSEEHAIQSIKGHDTPEYRIQALWNTRGNFDYVWNYLTRGKYNGAIEENKSLPFLTAPEKTLDELDSYEKIPYYPTQYIAVGDNLKGDARVNKIKEIIYNRGGVTAQIDEYWRYYAGTKYYYNTNHTMNNPHLIEIVGWDDSIDASKFGDSGVTQNGAFIAKNSARYGTTYLSYDSVDDFKYIMGITEVRDRSFCDYQYEHYELPYYPKNAADNSVFLVNRYTRKSSQYEELSSVNVMLQDTSTRFNVYVSPTGRFEDLAKVELKNCSGVIDGMYTMNNAGEFVVDLKNPMLLRNTEFLVGVELYNANKSVEYVAEMKYAYGNNSNGVNPVIRQGDSFRLKNSNLSFTNKDNFIDTYNEGYDVCIRAYTKNMNDISTITVDGTGEWHQNEFSFANKNTYKSTSNFFYKILYVGDYNHQAYTDSINMEYLYGTAKGFFSINKKMDDNFLGGLEMKFDKQAEIYITAKSDNGATLVLKDDNGNELDTATFSDNGIQVKSLYFTKNGGRVHIGLKDDEKIDIIKIQIKPLKAIDNTVINKTYNFSSSLFRDYVGMLSGEISVNGFVVDFSHYRTVSIISDAPSYNGYHYKSCLNLIATYKNTHFYTPANTDIYVTLKTVSNKDEYLYIENKLGTRFAELKATNNMQTYKFHYDGRGEQLYLNLALDANTIESRKIKVYSITVKTHNEVNDSIYKEWNFDSPEYYGLGTITESTNINGMDIYATQHKYVEFKNSNVNIDGIRRRRYLSLGGEGTESYRCIGFDVPQNCTIRILARSSSKTEPRTMIVTDEQNMLLGTIDVNSNTAAQYNVKYTGNGDKVYIKCKSGSLDIYGVELINSDVNIDYYNESISEAKNDNDIISDEMIMDDIVISESSVDIEGADGTNEENKEDLQDIEQFDEELASMLDVDNIIRYIEEFSLSAESNTLENAFKYKDMLMSEDELYFYNELYDIFFVKHCTEDVTYISIPTDLAYSSSNIENLRKSMRNAMTAFTNDYPEVFWINLNYKSIFKTAEYNGVQKLSSYGMLVSRNTNVGSVDVLINYIEHTDAFVKSIVDEMNSTSFRFNADYLKAEFLYNNLRDTVKYIDGLSKCNAYNVIINKNGNCSGIARAYKVLCDEAGIENIIVRCNISNKEYDHLCNLLKLDGKWYLCDLTSDLGKSENDYFMMDLPDNYVLKNPTSFTEETKIFTYPEISQYDYIILGDINLDGELTSDDADAAMAICLSGSSDRQKLLRADINENGTVDTTDVMLILQTVLDPDYNFGKGINSLSANYDNEYCINYINEIFEEMLEKTIEED